MDEPTRIWAKESWMGDESEGAGEGVVVEVFHRADDDWGFRVKNKNNGRILSTAGEGYTERNDACEAAEALFPDLPLYFVTDEEGPRPPQP